MHRVLQISLIVFGCALLGYDETGAERPNMTATADGSIGGERSMTPSRDAEDLPGDSKPVPPGDSSRDLGPVTFPCGTGSCEVAQEYCLITFGNPCSQFEPDEESCPDDCSAETPTYPEAQLVCANTDCIPLLEDFGCTPDHRGECSGSCGQGPEGGYTIKQGMCETPQP